jgi:hypothetical protein
MDAQLYIGIRNAIPLEKVSLGYRTVLLFPVADLEGAQLGYTVGDAGETLAGENEGDWKSSWLVIGHEDLIGDPIFVDLNTQELPVFTAAHGEGAWKPELIASSFEGFIKALEEIERVSDMRRNPVQLERNQLSDVERERVLRRIAELNGNASLEFWQSWFEV